MPEEKKCIELEAELTSIAVSEFLGSKFYMFLFEPKILPEAEQQSSQQILGGGPSDITAAGQILATVGLRLLKTGLEKITSNISVTLPKEIVEELEYYNLKAGTKYRVILCQDEIRVVLREE